MGRDAEQRKGRTQIAVRCVTSRITSILFDAGNPTKPNMSPFWNILWVPEPSQMKLGCSKISPTTLKIAPTATLEGEHPASLSETALIHAFGIPENKDLSKRAQHT